MAQTGLHWPWEMNVNKEVLYTDSKEFAPAPSPFHTRQKKYSDSSRPHPAHPPTAGTLPVEVSTQGWWIIRENFPKLSQHVTPTEDTDQWCKEITTEVQVLGDENALENFIRRNEQLWVVSDASQKDNKGAFAWIISTHDTELYTNTGIVYGQEESQTSFRTEAFVHLHLLTTTLATFQRKA